MVTVEPTSDRATDDEKYADNDVMVPARGIENDKLLRPSKLMVAPSTVAELRDVPKATNAGVPTNPPAIDVSVMAGPLDNGMMAEPLLAEAVKLSTLPEMLAVRPVAVTLVTTSGGVFMVKTPFVLLPVTRPLPVFVLLTGPNTIDELALSTLRCVTPKADDEAGASAKFGGNEKAGDI